MNILKSILDNYNNNGEKVSIVVSSNLFYVSDSNKEELIIFITDDKALQFVLGSEFDDLVSKNLVNESNILFRISDNDKIQRLSCIFDDYYITADFSMFMDNLINELSNKKVMKKNYE